MMLFSLLEVYSVFSVFGLGAGSVGMLIILFSLLDIMVVLCSGGLGLCFVFRFVNFCFKM